jgi:hypothetical protein
LMRIPHLQRHVDTLVIIWRAFYICRNRKNVGENPIAREPPLIGFAGSPLTGKHEGHHDSDQVQGDHRN